MHDSPMSDHHFLNRVAKQHFTDFSSQGRSLGDADGSILHFHPSARLRPNADHLAWHRTKHRIA